MIRVSPARPSCWPLCFSGPVRQWVASHGHDFTHIHPLAHHSRLLAPTATPSLASGHAAVPSLRHQLSNRSFHFPTRRPHPPHHPRSTRHSPAASLLFPSRPPGLPHHRPPPVSFFSVLPVWSAILHFTFFASPPTRLAVHCRSPASPRLHHHRPHTCLANHPR